MKTKLSLLILALALVISSLALVQCNPSTKERSSATQQSEPSPSEPANSAARVPAHYEARPNLDSLGPTLSPEKFKSKTRAAYQAVKEIPQTIAQLPCYCHCDQSIGHKSLHSCFEDDHAAHCVVCVDEALLAYRLEKEGLTGPQIRDRIVAEYSRQ